MVDPLSVTVGAGAALVAIAALIGVYLAGWRRSRAPDHVVDMNEVANYHRHVSSNEALSQDVEAADDGANL